MALKKILLIGENGQLGGSILRDTEDFEFDIVAFDKDEVDVTDISKVEEKINEIKPDILINTSAYNNLSKAEEDSFSAMRLNFIAVQNLARLCKNRGIIFVTYSTDYVFDGEKGTSYEEDDEPNPLQVYGFSKLAGEHATLNTYPEKSFVIRTCGVYGGKTGSPEKGNFVLNIIKEAEGKEVIEVSSEQIVSPTYAGDLSKATLKLLLSEAKPGIYHLVNEGQCSWYDFTREIFGLAGIKTEPKPIDRNGSSSKMKRPKFSALKNTRAKAVGIELPFWQKGLESYFKFLNSI